MRARAYAKINLGLRIRSRDADGYHPLRGVFQTIDWRDDVVVEDSDEDGMEVPGGGAPEDETNLAWRALAAARDAGNDARPIRVVLNKRIPSPAGLGGGSADAAAALNLAARRFSVSFDDVRRIAVDLGSDVPFAVVGGTAIVTGRGEFVSPQPDASGCAFAIVVPPISLDTASVYRSWDRLEGPRGPEIGADDLPPALRGYAPLGNDLYPAAVAIDVAIDEWRAELASRWGVPVMMTGSGAALFAYFPTRSEAEDAVSIAPDGAVAVKAAEPINR
ncbi:MAG: 4-(cytidine 5'-diphospho)-2-C-methyl-D-erythritol kinase, partial [Actinomycetota bacterium]|nr:4-(cytidine 5'-diphospho)-2-C-methyl-D-erythritol kinase [Actinomycetota bacterium]